MKINTSENKVNSKIPSRRFWKIGLVFVVAFFVFGFMLSVHVQEAKAQLDPVSTALLGPAAPAAKIGAWFGKSIAEGNTSLNPFKWLLYGIFQFMVWLLGIAGIIFGHFIDSKNISSIMQNKGIYQSWAMVRDFLNLGFILVLLYIAFCVIFQIGSYSDSWKKMLLMMVIMALLVNFSFPICRVIIDFSNVAFYFLTNSAFPGMEGESIFTAFGGETGFGEILKASTNDSVAYLVAMIVFTFILAITFLVIAILFVVRMVVIGILIVFSPIGFAGAAFPFSQKYAKDWWDNLFKYSFFAPIMMFMIMIAMNMMKYLDNSAMKLKASQNLGAGADIKPEFLGTAAFFSIPIVILWVGMHMAQKMSIAGASAVTGTADKFAKWAGKKASGVDFAQRTWGAYSTRRKQADEDRMSGKLGRLLGSQQDRLRGALPGGRDAQLRYQRDQIAQVKKEGERNDTVNMDETSLKQLAQSGDKFESAAAIMELAARGVADGTQLNNVRRSFGEDSQVAKQLQNKMKTYDAAAAFTNLKGEFQEARADEFVKSNQFDASKQNANSLGNTEFMQTVFGNKAISNKQVRDLAEKSTDNKNALNKSVGEILSLGGRDDTKDEINRTMHTAHFAINGGFHASIDGVGKEASRAEIFSRLDGDGGKNVNEKTIIKHMDEMVNNMNVGKVSDLVKNMNDKKARSAFMAGARNAASLPGANANAKAIQDHVNKNPSLRGY